MDHRYIFIECGIEGDENKQKLSDTAPVENYLHTVFLYCIYLSKLMKNKHLEVILRYTNITAICVNIDLTGYGYLQYNACLVRILSRPKFNFYLIINYRKLF